jgi:N-acetylglucosaminyldiphosphoundecaprenol N-acetyl-beta-D-mannosaminyltransferase
MVVSVLGVKLNAVKREESLERFRASFNGKKQVIGKINPEFIVNAHKDDKFRDVLNRSYINTADGTGILWAAKFLSLKTTRVKFLRELQILWQAIYSLGSIIFYPKFIKSPIPERVGGADLMWDMLKVCADSDKKVYLLGGSRGAAKKIKEKSEKEIKGLEIAGYFDGNASEVDVIVEDINKSKAGVLFVAFGSPKQEFWIDENLSKLKNIKVAVGEGGSFDFIAGIQKRAPFLIQKLGLEWVWRFAREPRRIKRIFNAVPYFIFLTIKYKMKSNEEN